MLKLKTVKELRQSTGLSQQKFGMLFRIAAINIANWEQGLTKPPEYVLYMLNRLVEIDPEVPKVEEDKDGGK